MRRLHLRFLTRLSLCLVCPAFAALVSTAAHAQVTGYTNLAQYNALATTATTYGFEGLTASGNFVFSPSFSPTLLTVDTGGDYLVIGSTYQGGVYSLSGTSTLAGAYSYPNNPSLGVTTIGFGALYTAVGTEFGFRAGTSAPYPTGGVRVQLFNGTTAIGNEFTAVVGNTGTFIGLTSTQAFDRARFTNTTLSRDTFQMFDNVRVGSFAITAAPEPASLALVGAGFVSMVGMIARRKAKL